MASKNVVDKYRASRTKVYKTKLTWKDRLRFFLVKLACSR